MARYGKIGIMRTILVFVVLLLAHPPLSHAAVADEPREADEASKQVSIYQSRGDNVPEGYITGRSLFAYSVTLPPAFRRSLGRLGSGDRWLDIGAGEGRAILDYQASRYDVVLEEPERDGEKAQAVAISIEDRRTPEWHEASASLGERIRYLSGRRLRDYSLDELGIFQIITDVFGGFSYAQDLSLFMEKALSFLAVGGSFYTLLQDVRFQQLRNDPFYKDASFLTEIQDGAGSEVKICSWMKSISCVEVTCAMKNGSPPIEMYSIRKVCDAVTVPRLLPIHFEAGTPPERRFQVTSGKR